MRRKGDAPSTQFTATDSVGVVASSVFDLPVLFDGCEIITTTGTSLTTMHETILRDVTIKGILDGFGQVVLTPIGAPFDAQQRLEGVITVESDAIPDAEPTLRVAGGKYTLDGVITNAEGQSGSVALTGAAELQGGTLDLGDAVFTQFIQSGGSLLGETEAVTNLGRYVMEGGYIGPGGLDNFGLVAFTATDGITPAVTRFENLFGGQVVQSGRVRLVPPGVFNLGEWEVVNNTDIVYETVGGTFPFDNAGVFRAVDAEALVDVAFDNTGTVEALNANIIFTKPVVQYDPETRSLTGGTWRIISAGTITIVDTELFVLREVEPAAKLVLEDVLTPQEALEALEKLSGDMDLINAARLDLRSNENDGDFIIEDSGVFNDGDSILGPGSEPARLIANRITNRGLATVFNLGAMQADVAYDLLDGGRLTGDLGVVETPMLNNVSGRVEPGYVAGFDLVPGGGSDRSAFGLWRLHAVDRRRAADRDRGSIRCGRARDHRRGDARRDARARPHRRLRTGERRLVRHPHGGLGVRRVRRDHGPKRRLM